jgi:hypothetical protein
MEVRMKSSLPQTNAVLVKDALPDAELMRGVSRHSTGGNRFCNRVYCLLDQSYQDNY